MSEKFVTFVQILLLAWHKLQEVLFMQFEKKDLISMGFEKNR
jgi:hypothetical protein